MRCHQGESVLDGHAPGAQRRDEKRCFWAGGARPDPPAGGDVGKPGFPNAPRRGPMFTLPGAEIRLW